MAFKNVLNLIKWHLKHSFRTSFAVCIDSIKDGRSFHVGKSKLMQNYPKSCILAKGH